MNLYQLKIRVEMLITANNCMKKIQVDLLIGGMLVWGQGFSESVQEQHSESKKAFRATIEKL